ncbi:TPA: NUMOD4 domain-containing protein [Elizabethkingia anophelis]
MIKRTDISLKTLNNTINSNTIWKPVVGYEEKYHVSEFGLVLNILNNKILKQGYNHKGYPKVTLYEKSKTKTVFVHRIVAFAFIDNPQNKETVNHKDGNKLNNHFSNLEWNTIEENNKHAIENKLLKINENCNTAKLSNNQVYEILYLISLKTPTSFLVKKYNVTDNTIYQIKMENNGKI